MVNIVVILSFYSLGASENFKYGNLNVWLLSSHQVLFELARYHAPSTIFLDELESVMSQRGTAPG